MYNYQLEHLKELEKQGIAEVLRPSEHIKISKVERILISLRACISLDYVMLRGF